MRRSKGFILAEILTVMLLQAGFILVLCGTFYLLVSFGSGTQQILTARERGQRVISYVDSRIKNAGLGMWRLTSSKQYRDVFDLFINEAGYKPLKIKGTEQLRLPVAITYQYKDVLTDSDLKVASPDETYENSDKHTIQYGNILTLLYAQRDLDRNFMIVNKSVIETETDPYKPKYELISPDEYKDDGSQFSKEDKVNKRKQEINSYAVMVGAGEPLFIENVPTKTNKKIELKFLDTITPTSANPIIISGDELLYLKCERLFAGKLDDEDTEKNFRFQKLTTNKYDYADWSERRPHERNILEIYMELDTETNILTLWVLASGGKDGRIHERPPYSRWPEKARWNNNEYKYHVIYISKASWKLNNIPNGFVWN